MHDLVRWNLNVTCEFHSQILVPSSFFHSLQLSVSSLDYDFMWKIVRKSSVSLKVSLLLWEAFGRWVLHLVIIYKRGVKF